MKGSPIRSTARAERWSVVLSGVLFLISFSIYLMTLAPTITWGNDGVDGGDLIAAAYTLGIPHPPGYPIYILLAKLFTFLPLGDIAYRVNLMSAFFAAATVALMYPVVVASCELLSKPGMRDENKYTQLVAGTAALMFAFSPVFWSQAVIAEVYTLNAFFVVLLLYLLVTQLRWDNPAARYKQDADIGHPESRTRYLASFVYGLSLGNHLSMLLFAPAGLFLMSQRGYRNWLKPKIVVAMGLSFLSGLLPYLYLPLRAVQNPPLNWGDPRTLSGFWWLVSGALYRRFFFSLPLVYVPGRVSAWANLLTQQFGWWGLFLGLVGLWYWFQNRHPFLGLSLFFFSAISVYALGYNTTDSYVYLIPAYLIFAIWLGSGLYLLFTALMHLGKGVRTRALLVFALILLPLLPAMALWLNFSSLDLSTDRTAYDYGVQVFATLPSRAIVIAGTDPHTFTLWYFQHVVETQSDVIVLSQGLLPYRWYRDNVRRRYPQVIMPNESDNPIAGFFTFIEGNLSSYPIYLTDLDPIIMRRYPVVEQGQLYRLEKR